MSSWPCRRSWIMWRWSAAMCSCRSKHCRGIVNLAEFFDTPTWMGGFQWVFLMFFSGPCKLPSFFTPLKNYNYIWKISMFNRKYIGSNGGFSIVVLVLLLYFGQSNAAGGLETMEICKCKKPRLDIVALSGQLLLCWSTFKITNPYPNVCGNDAPMGQFALLRP